jgi:hypothetical protein
VETKPNYWVERREDGTATAFANFYALSLLAYRDSPSEAAHEASWSNAMSEDEAKAEGTQSCQSLWPSSEGWKHNVAAKLVSLKIDLNKAS